MKCVAKLAKLATAVTAVKAGDNEFTLYDGIKFLSNVDVVVKLRCSCQQLVTGPIIVYTCQSLTNYLTGLIAIPMIGNYSDTN